MGQPRLDPAERRLRTLWRWRVRNWVNRGVLEAPGRVLRRETYEAVLSLQGHACALCGRGTFWGALAADHDARTGLFRGCLCEPDCNRHAVGKFEQTGRFGTRDQQVRIREYLANPPYARYLREKGGETAEIGAFLTPRAA